LRTAGFNVETLDVADLNPEDVERHRLSYKTTQLVFVCT
jgi:hypothetical protein